MNIVPLAMFGLGVPELLIILAVVLLLFGGSRLAGLGKSTGRALKEFKEETKGLKGAEGQPGGPGGTANPYEAGTDPSVEQSGQSPQSGSPYGETPSTGTPYNQPPTGGSPYGQTPQNGSPYGQSPQNGSPYGQTPQDGTGSTGSAHDTRRDV